MDPQQQLILALRAEIKTLKDEVAFLRAGSGARSMAPAPKPPSSGSSLSDARLHVQERLIAGSEFIVLLSFSV